MEEILIPMVCLYDIPSLNPMSMPSYKKGDIFMYNPYHEIHVELDEHGCFVEVENNLCDFICQYPHLFVNGTYYEVGEKIADKDIKSFDDETLKSLYYIGHIQKKLKPKQATKNKNAKKVAETYAILAKKLGYNKDDFKTTLLDKAGIEVKDMRKKVPNKIKKQIIEVLSK